MIKLWKKMFGKKSFKVVELDRRTLDIIANEALILADEECPSNSHDSDWMKLANVANLLSIAMEVKEYKHLEVTK